VIYNDSLGSDDENEHGHIDENFIDVVKPVGHAPAEETHFEIEPFPKKCLLEGLDDVALTLQQEDALAAYEASHTAPISTLALS